MSPEAISATSPERRLPGRRRREPVQMQHLLRAARSEYAKLEKSLTEGEIKGWV
jgi:hypothetical protein